MVRGRLPGLAEQGLTVARALVVVTQPTFEPVTLSEVKAAARVDHSDLDTWIEVLVTAAREEAEADTGRTLVTTTLKLVLDEFPAWEIELPRPPLVSVTSITYTDTDGTTQTLVQGTDYEVSTAGVLGLVRPCYGEDWPSDLLDHEQVVEITYVAGYTLAQYAERRLQGVKAWMIERVSTQIDNPQSVVQGTIMSPKPKELTDRFLGRYRVPRVV
jgi:uncharacterized phiE125 gp8 family phage protein